MVGILPSLAVLPDLGYYFASAARAADGPRKGFNPPLPQSSTTFYSSPKRGRRAA